MTDTETIKALECLSGINILCKECAYHKKFHYPDCRQEVAEKALDLINRQKAELAELKSENKILKDSNINLQELYEAERAKVANANEKCIGIAKALKIAKAEAVKEFANYLQEELIYHIGRVAWLIEFGEDKEQTKYYQGVEKTLKNMNTLIDEKLKETVGADAEKSSENVANIYTIKICKNCIFHNENACRINIGLWKDDDFCSLWKEKI